MPASPPPPTAVPQNAYPTPPRFVGAVLRFLVIALLDRMVRRVVVRLGRPQQPARAAASPSSSAPLSGDRR